MEVLELNSEKEFVKSCVNLISKENRMFRVSTLFMPLFNKDGYLPKINPAQISAIKKSIDGNDIAKAEKAFIEICSEIYGKPGLGNTSKIKHVINNVGKDPLYILDSNMAIALKDRVIINILEKYYKDPLLGNLVRSDFTKDIERLTNNVSIVSDRLNKLLSKEEVVDSAGSETLPNMSPTVLKETIQDNLNGYSSPDNIKEVAVELLMYYLNNYVSWSHNLRAELHSRSNKLSWKNLINYYEIDLDTLATNILNNKGEKYLYDKSLFKLLIGTYSHEVWNSSDNGCKLLLHIYKHQYNRLIKSRKYNEEIMDKIKSFEGLQNNELIHRPTDRNLLYEPKERELKTDKYMSVMKSIDDLIKNGSVQSIHEALMIVNKEKDSSIDDYLFSKVLKYHDRKQKTSIIDMIFQDFYAIWSSKSENLKKLILSYQFVSDIIGPSENISNVVKYIQQSGVSAEELGNILEIQISRIKNNIQDITLDQIQNMIKNIKEFPLNNNTKKQKIVKLAMYFINKEMSQGKYNQQNFLDEIREMLIENEITWNDVSKMIDSDYVSQIDIKLLYVGLFCMVSHMVVLFNKLDPHKHNTIPLEGLICIFNRYNDGSSKIIYKERHLLRYILRNKEIEGVEILMSSMLVQRKNYINFIAEMVIHFPGGIEDLLPRFQELCFDYLDIKAIEDKKSIVNGVLKVLMDKQINIERVLTAENINKYAPELVDHSQFENYKRAALNYIYLNTDNVEEKIKMMQKYNKYIEGEYMLDTIGNRIQDILMLKNKGGISDEWLLQLTVKSRKGIIDRIIANKDDIKNIDELSSLYDHLVEKQEGIEKYIASLKDTMLEVSGLHIEKKIDILRSRLIDAQSTKKQQIRDLSKIKYYYDSIVDGHIKKVDFARDMVDLGDDGYSHIIDTTEWRRNWYWSIGKYVSKTYKELHTSMRSSYYDDRIDNIARGFLQSIDQWIVEGCDLEQYRKKLIELIKNWYIYTKKEDKLKEIKDLGLVRLNDDEYKNLEIELRNFLNGDNIINLEEFRSIVSMFPIEAAVDVLYALHPHFRGLDRVDAKSLIAEYLGDTFMHSNGIIGKVKIPEGISLLNKNIQDNMQLVIKQDFLQFYKKRRKEHNVDDKDVCLDYIHKELSDKLLGVGNGAMIINQIKEDFKHFLLEVADMQKPDNFVDGLDTFRNFPDFLQKLNARQILDKRRFLIADGMGMGKSLSSVLAREVGLLGTTLLAVPSNMTDTRKGYLSSDIDEQGSQVGYFKMGFAPKVLVVTSPSDLSNDLNTYDYIIISHERLADNQYIDGLIDISFNYMIVDEIHKLKNIYSGKRSQGLISLAEKIEDNDGYLCLLSGTPIPNTISDLAVLIKLLYPKEYGRMSNQELVKSVLQSDSLHLRGMLLQRMEMKKLVENVDMPDLYEKNEYVLFSDKEKEYYSILLEDEGYSFNEKLMALRKFTLSPMLLGLDDIGISSKIQKISKDIKEVLLNKDKLVVFINSFINGVIRPTHDLDQKDTIIAQLDLGNDIAVDIIDGSNRMDRTSIQKKFFAHQGKMVLFVSGKTADVGIDLTAAEHMIHIDDPWTKADKDQQIARVYRYRQNKDITSTTYLTSGSIDAVINNYIFFKENIILKLYHGFDLSEVESVIIESELSGKNGGGDDVNRGLIAYMENSRERLGDFFAITKYAGGQKVKDQIDIVGSDVARYYKKLKYRSYAANVNRVNMTIIEKLHNSESKKINILDLGCGPKMLQEQYDGFNGRLIFNLDLNSNYFTEEDLNTGNSIVGSFDNIPLDDDAVEIVSSSLSWHDTIWNVNKNQYERLKTLYEMMRVLKDNGHAVISLPYSVEIKDRVLFKQIINILGGEVIDKYTGFIAGDGFGSYTIVIRKKAKNNKSYEECMYAVLSTGRKNGLVLDKAKRNITTTTDIIQSVNINNSTDIDVILSKNSKSLLSLQEGYKVQMRKLIDTYGHIDSIPKPELYKWGYGRYGKGMKSSVIFAKLPNDGGMIKIRMNKKINNDTSSHSE